MFGRRKEGMRTHGDGTREREKKKLTRESWSKTVLLEGLKRDFFMHCVTISKTKNSQNNQCTEMLPFSPPEDFVPGIKQTNKQTEKNKPKNP